MHDRTLKTEQRQREAKQPRTARQRVTEKLTFFSHPGTAEKTTSAKLKTILHVTRAESARFTKNLFRKAAVGFFSRPLGQANKSKGRMPRRQEPKKDVESDEKPRGGANGQRSADVRMGEPGCGDHSHS